MKMKVKTQLVTMPKLHFSQIKDFKSSSWLKSSSKFLKLTLDYNLK